MTNENQMYTQAKYKCAICGQIYDELRERINCETACLKRQEEEAKKAEELKKRAEKEARHNEIDMLFEQTAEALMDYIEDYGSYEYNGKLAIPDSLKLLNMLRDLGF